MRSSDSKVTLCLVCLLYCLEQRARSGVRQRETNQSIHEPGFECRNEFFLDGLSHRHFNATTDGFETIGIRLQTAELILTQAMQFVACLIGSTTRTEVIRQSALEGRPSGDGRSQFHKTRISTCQSALHILLARAPPMQSLVSQEGFRESDLLTFRRW